MVTPGEEGKWARIGRTVLLQNVLQLSVLTQNPIPHHFNASHCFYEGEKENILIFGNFFLRPWKIQSLHDSFHNWEMCDKPSTPCYTHVLATLWGDTKSLCWTWMFDYSTKTGDDPKMHNGAFYQQHHSLSFRMWHQWILHWTLPINLCLWRMPLLYWDSWHAWMILMAGDLLLEERVLRARNSKQNQVIVAVIPVIHC